MPSCHQVTGGPATPNKDTPKKASPFSRNKAQTAKSPVSTKNPTASKKTASTTAHKKRESSPSKAKAPLWANTIVPKIKPDDYDTIVEHQTWFLHNLMTRQECDELAHFWVTNEAEFRSIDQCFISSNVSSIELKDWILRCLPKAHMSEDVNEAIIKLKGCIEVSHNQDDIFTHSAKAALMINRFHLRKAVVFFFQGPSHSLNLQNEDDSGTPNGGE
jgi:hypothetical protein